MDDLIQIISKYGFPIVAAAGMGWMISYVWHWATNTVKPVLDKANKSLAELSKGIQILDNDLARLSQKISIADQIQNRDNLKKSKRSD